VHDGKTEIVVQVAVPSSPGAYGGLIPLPAQPTLDATPVDSAELDDLERSTRVVLLAPPSDGGCGCPLVAGGASTGNTGGDTIVVGPPVAIGPVTAVVLDGSSESLVTAWLAANDFVIPAQHASTLAAYAGPGRYFVALHRNGDTVDAPSSIGVHLTLDGDQRGLPLRFTRIGAGASLAFLVFVVADAAAGPTAPYASLTMKDLDVGEVRSTSYAQVLAAAIAGHGSQAFAIEDEITISGNKRELGAQLGALVRPGQRLVRWTTIVDPVTITADADFSGTAPASPQNWLGSRARHAAPVALAALAIGAWGVRRARRRAS
jgi:hypothetical protein